jgi:hypothetical protein
MVKQETSTLGRFMFAVRPVSMSEHADGDADDLPAALVTVYLNPGLHISAHRGRRFRLNVDAISA